MGAASLVQESEDSGSRFCGEAAWRDCAVNATILPAVPQCNPGGPVDPSRPTADGPDEDLLSSRPDVPTVPGHTSRSALGSKGEGVKTTRVRTAEARTRSAARALRACALGIGRTEAPTEASRAYKRSAKAAHKPPRPANSTGPGPAGLRRAAESSWPAGSPDDRINDRPPGIFHLGRRCTGAWAADGPHHRTALSTWGRFCCAEAETWDARSTLRLATG